MNHEKELLWSLWVKDFGVSVPLELSPLSGPAVARVALAAAEKRSAHYRSLGVYIGFRVEALGFI